VKMSDVDDDFMCEDEEDYGLVSKYIVKTSKKVIYVNLCKF